MPNRLRSISIQNYLGAGDAPIVLEMDSQNVLLIGPNNSGKSVLCGALQFFKHLSREPFGAQESGFYKAHRRSDDRVSVDVIHKGRDAATISATFDVDCAGNEIGRTLYALGINKSVSRADMRIDIALFADGTKQLKEIEVGGRVVFRQGESTLVVRFNPNSRSYLAENPILLQRLFDLPRDVSRTIVSFSSKRYLEVSGGDPADIDALASGESLAGWVRSANSPAAHRPADRERHAMLREFEKEFARFVGAETINVNASDGGINLTVNGELMPIGRLGTGIGECLIILLVCKIAGQSKLLPGMSICALEEPELFLHPKLQRQLVDLIQTYGVQLIATTHSPTILDYGWRANWKIFATHFNSNKGRIEVEPLSRGGIGGVLAEIGVRPSDWLQADGVLFVEGPSDVPVYKKWLTLAPNHAGKNISVIPIGGRMTANAHFDFSELNKLGRAVAVIMDSERTKAGNPIEPSRAKIQNKCDDAGIPCLLTERRATENYFSDSALAGVYGSGVKIGAYEKPNDVVAHFHKQRNDEVVAQMVWADIDNTDVGRAIHAFIGRLA